MNNQEAIIGIFADDAEKASELQERYGTGAVEFENVVGKLPRLHIKYSDKPFDWLFTASPKEITEFAKSMYDDAWGLRWRIEERIDNIIKGLEI